jgi:hypothetical protein
VLVTLRFWLFRWASEGADSPTYPAAACGERRPPISRALAFHRQGLFGAPCNRRAVVRDWGPTGGAVGW